MADFNIRGIDERLAQQVRIAAARRQGKGQLRRWIIQALTRAVQEEGLAKTMPRLKLCAQCVLANQERAQRLQACSLGFPSILQGTESGCLGQNVELSRGPFADLLETLGEQSSSDALPEQHASGT